MIQFLFTLILSLALFCTNAQVREYLPTSSGEVIKHSYFTLSYIERYEQAEWVYYHLTPEMVNGDVARTNNFRADPKVSTTSAHTSDYTGSGYDRGHLCPAVSMAHNKVAMSESFYMSNISPQSPSFNRGGWKTLEGYVRRWAGDDAMLHVVTGAIFSHKMKYIGANKVAVPEHFYKAIYSSRKESMIAFVMPNRLIDKDIKSYAITVDSLETLTKIDFFPALPDNIENRLEASYNLSMWEFKPFEKRGSTSK